MNMWFKGETDHRCFRKKGARITEKVEGRREEGREKWGERERNREREGKGKRERRKGRDGGREGERERGAHKGTHKETISPKPFARKTRRADFCELLQLVGLKAWSIKGQQFWLG